MIDWFQRVPGWALAHPWTFLLLVALASAGYLGLLAAYLSSQDRTDARRNARKYR